MQMKAYVMNCTPAEETAGKQLLEAVVSASRSLTICAKELEKNCSLSSDVKDSAVALESLTAGVCQVARCTGFMLEAEENY